MAEPGQPSTGGSAPSTIARRPKPDDLPGILESMAEGHSLRQACFERGIHPGHAHAMFRSDDRWWAQYVRVREFRGDGYGEKVAEIAELVKAGTVAPDVARVMMDAYKWTAGRMASKVWGDKVSHEHTGAGGGPIQTVNLTNLSDEELERLEALISKANQTPPGA